MAPKGIIDNTTWQRISRSVDYFDTLYSLLSGELDISEETELRLTPIGNEVTEWRALLRYSGFLMHKNETDVFNIHGDVINPELASISNVLSDKRKMYFKMHLSGHKLENIRLNPFLITEGLEDFSGEESC